MTNLENNSLFYIKADFNMLHTLSEHNYAPYTVTSGAIINEKC